LPVELIFFNPNWWFGKYGILQATIFTADLVQLSFIPEKVDARP
jgi:hypothetical protein